MIMRTSVITFSVFLAATVMFWVALANIHYISPPRLVIQFDGKPAGNVKLILPISSGAGYQLDGDGSITSPTPGSESAILVPRPSGGAVSVRFPNHGTKTVDISDQMTKISLVQYWGLVNDQMEQLSLTQEQVAEIESGHKTLAEIEEQMRTRD